MGMLQMTTPAAQRQRASRARRLAQDPDAYRAKQALDARDYRRRVRAAKIAALPDALSSLVGELVGPEERAREAEALALAAQRGRLEAADELTSIIESTNEASEHFRLGFALLAESFTQLARVRDQIQGVEED